MLTIWLFACGLFIDRTLSGAHLLNANVGILFIAVLLLGRAIYLEGIRVLSSSVARERSIDHLPQGEGRQKTSVADTKSPHTGETLFHRLNGRPLLALSLFIGVFSLPIVMVAMTAVVYRRPFVTHDIWSIVIGELFFAVCLWIAWRRASNLIAAPVPPRK
jgi:hypothetical protein